MQKYGAYQTGERKKRTGCKTFLRAVAGIVVFCTVTSQLLPAFATESENVYCQLDHEHGQSCRMETVLDNTGESPLDLTGMILHTHNKFCHDMDGNIICPLPKVEEHEHDDACYEIRVKETEPTEEPHVHSEGCYTKEQGAQICTLEEQPGHTHTDECYELLEQETENVHTHTSVCYLREQGELTCIIPVREGHIHGDTCFAMSEELICGVEESEAHTHAEACFGKTVVCGRQEDIGHAHGDPCYEWTENLICDLEEVLPEETTPSKILVCTETEMAPHTHGDTCYEWAEVLSCGKEELPEEDTEPTEPEKVLICTKPELKNHIHAEECYETDLSGVVHLVCEEYQMEEHQHTEDCLGFPEAELLCELAEGEEHQHGYGCYRSWTFLCQMTEEPEPETEPATEPETEPITESLENLADPTADVERRKDWEKTFEHVELTGAWSYDLIAIAQTQLGYKESVRNYIVLDNDDIKGYTRYGAWYGSTYANWCAMFVSFCLTYAGVEGFPRHPGCDRWITELKKVDLYATADVYMPKLGDVVFFDCSRNSETAPIDSDHVGIVTEVIPATHDEPAKITTIEGNKDNAVAEGEYYLDDLRILGYGILPDGPAAVYSCGQEVHAHDADYYSKESNVICQRQEHTHNEICRSRELRYADDSLWAAVTLSNAVYLPEDLELKMELITDQQELPDGMVSAVVNTMGENLYSVNGIRFCRMELLSDGQPYRLPKGVLVDAKISFEESAFAAKNPEELHTFMLIEEESDTDSPTLEPYRTVELSADYYGDQDRGIAGLYVCTNQISTVAIAPGKPPKKMAFKNWFPLQLNNSLEEIFTLISQ